MLSEPRDVAPRPTPAPPTPDWVRSAGSQGGGALAHPLAGLPARGTVCVSVSPTGHETCTHTERCRDKGGAASSPLACGGRTMTPRVPLPVTSAPAGSRNRQGPLNPERLPGAGRWSRGWPLTRSTAGASGLGRVALTRLDAAPVKELVRPLRPLLGLEPEPSGKPQGHWPCSDWGHPARLRSPPGPLWLWRTGRRGQGAAAAHRTAQEAAGRPLWGRGLSERSPAPHSPHALPSRLSLPPSRNCTPGCLRLRGLVADQPSASGAASLPTPDLTRPVAGTRHSPQKRQSAKISTIRKCSISRNQN